MPADHQVMVAGGGPTGLAAALFLARRGVSVRIIDAAERPSPTSRALGVNPRTLALLEDTGVSARIASEGQALRRFRLHRRGRRLATVEPDWPALGAARPMTILPQARTEALLAEALGDHGVAVERGMGLDDLDQDEAGVTVRLSDGMQARAEVLFGADGARSTVRKRLGLGFPGDSWDDPWELMDVALEGPRGDEAWIDFRPHGPFVCLPFAGGVYRLIGFGAPLLDTLPPGWRAGEVLWRSEFRISHRMAPRMTLGRVGLGGDAAHIHSPIGARGMNLGIEDAFVFAACAADALRGEPGRLDDHHRLRHPVDVAVVRRVRALTTAARDMSGRADLARRLLIPLAARLPPIRDRLVRTAAGLDHPVRIR